MKKLIKRWLFGKCPGLSGRFPYFGCTVYFPKGSQAFEAACQQGIFEQANANLLRNLSASQSHVFDVGANIGLMALPILEGVPDCIVVSCEPSPNALPWLLRTVKESRYSARWKIIPKAVGSELGRADFFTSTRDLGMYDGLRSSNQVSSVGKVSVEVTTLDHEWDKLGRPPVSVLKIDVEGAEAAVLRGASSCLAECRPHILLEWNRKNPGAFNSPAGFLFQFASENKYRLFAMPMLVPVLSQTDFRLQMALTESFLLAP